MQSNLRPYWGRGVSLKRDRPELVNLCLGKDISEGERSEMNRVPTTLVQPDDRGYDSCDSEDLDSGFLRYRESNLATWLGKRLPWAGWRLEAMLTMRAPIISASSWL